MVKLNTTTKKVEIILFCLIVIIGILVIFLHSNSSSDVGFHEYSPNYLPSNVKITSRSIIKYSKNDGIFANVTVFISELNSIGSYISEAKNINFSYTCTPQPSAIKCSVVKTPQGQSYQLTTSYSESTPFEQEVIFVKTNTEIDIMLSEEKGIDPQGAQAYSQNTWSKVVDSFTPAHYANVQIIRR